MARYEDSAAGWQIYKEHEGELSLIELNELLKSRGFRPVAPRSLQHYRRLERLGYEEYVSINRLDLRHASDVIFDVTDRSRYEERNSEFGATLFLPTSKKPQVLVAKGSIVRISEGFASLVLTDHGDDLIRATRSAKFNRGVLRFDTSGYERAVQVSEAVEYPDRVEILLTFRSLLSADILFPDQVGATTRSRLTISLPQEPTLHVVVMSMHRTFDLLESIRGMVETAITGVPEPERPIIASPRIQSLTAGSPLIQDLVTATWVTALAIPFLKLTMSMLKDYAQIARDAQETKTLADNNRRAQERHEIEIKSLQLEGIKREIDARMLLGPISEELKERYAVALDDLQGPQLARLEALKDQAVEAVAELSANSETVEMEFADQSADAEGV